MPQPKKRGLKMTFANFLMLYIEADNAVGDFARDAKQSEDFPKDGTMGVYSAYLTDRRASREARKAFRVAYRQYMLREGANHE